MESFALSRGKSAAFASNARYWPVDLRRVADSAPRLYLPNRRLRSSQAGSQSEEAVGDQRNASGQALAWRYQDQRAIHANRAADTSQQRDLGDRLGRCGPGRDLADPNADWDIGLFAILLGFSIFSDVTSIEMESRLKISGSFLAIVLAMVFLGCTPAALIGVISIVAGSIRFREKWNDFFFNLLTYITFPVIVGTAFHEIVECDRDHAFRPDLLLPGLRRLPGRAGAQLFDDRRLHVLPRPQLFPRKGRGPRWSRSSPPSWPRR